MNKCDKFEYYDMIKLSTNMKLTCNEYYQEENK